MSKTCLFYFSGTGNSRVIAQALAGRLQARCMSMAKSAEVESSWLTATDAVGFVFPVHMFGVPRFVERFIQDRANLAGRYVFAVATYAGLAGGTMNRLEKLVTRLGGQLSGGFVIPMPNSYIPLGGPPPTEVQAQLFLASHEKVEQIATYVQARQQGTVARGRGLVTVLTGLAHNLASTQVSTMDKSFRVNETCNSCGLCQQLCPVGNIVLQNDHPEWRHHCEQCFACLQWCPQQAIQFGKKSEHTPRYHHPELAALND